MEDATVENKAPAAIRGGSPSLASQIVLGMVLGVIVGTVAGGRAAPIGEIGKLIIQAIKVFATPLLFFAILHAVVTTRIEARGAKRMLGVAFLNGTIALAIGLLLSNLFRVGDRLAPLFAAASGGAPLPAAASKIDFGRFISTFVPTSILQPFVENIAVTVILLALLLGFALRSLQSDKTLTPVVEAAVGAAQLGLRVTELILGWIIRTIPIAVFAVVAQAVGRSGVEALSSLGYYVGIALLGLGLHVLITHQIWILYLGRSLREIGGSGGGAGAGR
jgi:aerobic C4-dicarboxylate transport protein